MSEIDSKVDSSLIAWAASLDCELRVKGEDDSKVYRTQFGASSTSWRSSREVYCYLCGLGDERFKDVGNG